VAIAVLIRRARISVARATLLTVGRWSKWAAAAGDAMSRHRSARRNSPRLKVVELSTANARDVGTVMALHVLEDI
jgi:hypothetical protein